MILVSALAALLVGLVLSQNPCHSDCLPFQCHGRASNQCSQCAGNRELVVGECRCKLGYFDSFAGQPCAVYSWDCLEATVASNNAVTCTRCLHNS